jgi:hypothetical protein
VKGKCVQYKDHELLEIIYVYENFCFSTCLDSTIVQPVLTFFFWVLKFVCSGILLLIHFFGHTYFLCLNILHSEIFKFKTYTMDSIKRKCADTSFR